MATLADVIRKRRKEGQSRTSSFAGSLKEKILEKIDPRQILNQSGVLTALFPSLKTYKATGIGDSKNEYEKIKNKLQDDSNPVLERIIKNTKISAKNFILLPNISRDVNVMKQNLIKLIKFTTGNPAIKADMHFLKQKEVEKLYESKFSESQNDKTVSKLEKNESEKKGFNWLTFLGLVGTGVASALIVDFLMNRENSVVSKLYDGVKQQIDEFKENVKTYVSGLYDSMEKNIDQQMNLISKSLDDLMEDLSDVELTRMLVDAFDATTSVTDQFEEKIEAARKKISEGLKQFSILPTAQASTLTSLPSPIRERLEGGRRTEKLPFSQSQLTQASTTQDLLDVISNSEGTSDERARREGFSSGYDVPYNYGKNIRPDKPLSQMTLAEVKDFQQKQISATRGSIPGTSLSQGTGAVGKYQITSGTLQSLQSELGLKDTDIFSPQLQDRMAIHLMRKRGLEKYLNKQMPAGQFQNQLAREWASIPTTTGIGMYGQPVSSGFSLSPTNAKITSGFGTRMHPITGQLQQHGGIDVAVPSGTPIKSVKTGKVIFAGEQTGYGYSVEVKHDDDTSTFYAHLSGINVRVGQTVNGGEILGLSGGGKNDPGKGTSTGPHLHFELKVGGRKVDPGKDLALTSITVPSLAGKEPEKESTIMNVLSSLLADEESEPSTVTKTIIISQNNTQTITEQSPMQSPKVDYGNQLLSYTT